MYQRQLINKVQIVIVDITLANLLPYTVLTNFALLPYSIDIRQDFGRSSAKYYLTPRSFK